MRGFIFLILPLTLFVSTSCEECSNCKPFTEEPFLKVRFLNLADSSNREIIIDSINQIYAKDVRQLQDTTFEFKFPLDMYHDTSIFQIVYRDKGNLDNYLTNTFSLTYMRQFLHRDDNYVIVKCDLTSTDSDFAQLELICNDTTNIKCISNEAVAKIFN